MLPDSALRVFEVEAGWYATVSTNRGDDFAEHLLRERDLCWFSPATFMTSRIQAILYSACWTKPEIFREGVLRI